MEDIGNVIESQYGIGQRTVGISIPTFLASLGTAATVFCIQFVIFLLVRSKLTRIYQPRTYLVPERERTTQSPASVFRWIIPIFCTPESEFIEKCGLDAYFFLRYLRMLLKIFIPLSLLLLPVLLTVDKLGGKDMNLTSSQDGAFVRYNVSGLDQLAWGNIRPENSQRYWVHLVLAVIAVVYVCAVFFDELRDYIHLRQSYLTSPQHRLRASATTVLVTSIPSEFLSDNKLRELFDIFPGGIRNIWLNRNFDRLSAKIKLRDQLASSLELAQTKLIRRCKKADLKARAKEQGTHKSRALSRAECNQIFARASISPRDPSPANHTELMYPWQRGESYNPTKAPIGTYAFARRHERVGSSARRRRHEEVGAGRSLELATQFDGEKLLGINGSMGVSSNDHLPSTKGINRGSPQTSNSKYDRGYEEPAWKRYIAEKDRDTMRLPLFGWKWMPTLPLLGKRVDTIYYCRKELARLNLEIEIDQQHPEKFPLVNSAFVQFNQQCAAHMACQSVSHHIPKQMTPRIVEVFPDDIIWDNMSISWWGRYIRVCGVVVAVGVIIIGWTFPVAFTGFISQLSYLQVYFTWLRWLNKIPQQVLSAVQGILPPLFLAALMVLLPLALRLLSRYQGAHTGTAVELTVQNYYFAFLFVQVFFIASISSSVSTILGTFRDLPSIPELLAENIPKAGNYFFSYMVIQAMSVSAGALLQISGLVSHLFLAPIMDTTARKKWIRATDLNQIRWGTFFPVYTTLASIGRIIRISACLHDTNVLGLIYCIISPLILIFSVLTFALFWIVYRYNTLYVTKFRVDTGGLLFPRAVNQLFTGLYVMEVCLIGMFSLIRDDKGKAAGIGQAVCMTVLFVLTGLFQYSLNEAFDPLSLYLPFTLEDEATQRDREFSHIQREREIWSAATKERELGYHNFNLDLESRCVIVNQPLFTDINDELKDLTTERRNQLVKQAFQHEALRARCPVIWIPKDDIGVSDDEILRTKRVAEHILISNECQTLDSSCRVLCSGSPPDFSEVDLIRL